MWLTSLISWLSEIKRETFLCWPDPDQVSPSKEHLEPRDVSFTHARKWILPASTWPWKRIPSLRRDPRELHTLRVSKMTSGQTRSIRYDAKQCSLLWMMQVPLQWLRDERSQRAITIANPKCEPLEGRGLLLVLITLFPHLEECPIFGSCSIKVYQRDERLKEVINSTDSISFKVTLQVSSFV